MTPDILTLPGIRRGDEGEPVRILQTILRNQGWYAYLVTGKFDLRTESATRRFQETHLGPTGENLVVDGRVGPKTWWALKYPSGPAQASVIRAIIPKGVSDERRALLEIWLHEHELGIREIPDGSNWSTAPEGGIAKYATRDSVSGPAAWCMRFIKWGVFKAVEAGLIPAEPANSLRGGGSCKRTMASAEELNEEFESGVWFPNDGFYIPRPADIAIMEGHVFAVTRADFQRSAGGRISKLKMNSVEGNAGNRVKQGLRSGEVTKGFINLFGDGMIEATYEVGIVPAKDLSGDSTR